MKLIVEKNYDNMSERAAKIMAEEINKKPDIVLGLATGSTPMGMYERLIERHKKGQIDFSEVVSFNLDEYVGLDGSNASSYRAFMDEKFFNHININRDNIYVPDGKVEDLNSYCIEYDRIIERMGGIDLQILGVGTNGHIAFLEPAKELPIGTSVTELTENTIKDNSRFFDRIEEVPKTAISMGIGSILRAKKIILLANGGNKSEVINKFLKGEIITTDFPLSFLALHPDVTVIVDETIIKK